MLKLGVNIDHVATLRQARYRGMERGEPDPIAAALLCEQVGAHGITAHLREDRRHIIDRDMVALRKAIRTRLNFEMANAPEIVDIALAIRPDIVCLVPEKREEISTEGGLDVVGHEAALRETIRRMKDAGIEVSLFVDPDPIQVECPPVWGLSSLNCTPEPMQRCFTKRPSETGNWSVWFQRLSGRIRWGFESMPGMG